MAIQARNTGVRPITIILSIARSCTGRRILITGGKTPKESRMAKKVKAEGKPKPTPKKGAVAKAPKVK